MLAQLRYSRPRDHTLKKKKIGSNWFGNETASECPDPFESSSDFGTQKSNGISSPQFVASWVGIRFQDPVGSAQKIPNLLQILLVRLLDNPSHPTPPAQGKPGPASDWLAAAQKAMQGDLIGVENWGDLDVSNSNPFVFKSLESAWHHIHN